MTSNGIIAFFELKHLKVNVIVNQLRSNKEKQWMSQKL